jgi:hypothetical protein
MINNVIMSLGVLDNFAKNLKLITSCPIRRFTRGEGNE